MSWLRKHGFKSIIRARGRITSRIREFKVILEFQVRLGFMRPHLKTKLGQKVTVLANFCQSFPIFLGFLISVLPDKWGMTSRKRSTPSAGPVCPEMQASNWICRRKTFIYSVGSRAVASTEPQRDFLLSSISSLSQAVPAPAPLWVP